MAESIKGVRSRMPKGLKVTRHYNQLSEAEAERLAILIEECSEVIQAATKIQRHGHRHYHTTETNREQLEREIGDLVHAIKRMQTASDINPLKITARVASKPQMIRAYLHHQDDAL
jgi:hypothetical protein